MEDKIKSYLSALEQEKDISILLACETGSRAWGFPSPDSDYDVRLIYKHQTEWYLSITEAKDTIELMLDNNEVDISGWDLRKSLRLLWKSNPPLLERIQSPIIYRQNPNFISGIRELSRNTYSKIATMHHYLSIAIKSYEQITAEPEYKLKSFFYGLRTATACKWILERNEMPPISFPQMLDGIQIDQSLSSRIRELIELKAERSESYRHKGESDLLSFMQQCIETATEKAQDLPPAKGRIQDVNAFFRNMILST